MGNEKRGPDSQPDEVAQNFGRSIRQRLASANMSQQDLSLALGIGKATVCGWYAGKAVPRAAMLKKVAAFFGCTMADLLTPQTDDADPAKGEALAREVVLNLADPKRRLSEEARAAVWDEAIDFLSWRVRRILDREDKK